ncbi:MAG: tetratricopeptide repeat protein [Desulfobacterales bacterium]
MRLLFFQIFLLLIPAVTFPLLSQTASAAESPLPQAKVYYRTGRYSEALTLFQKAGGADRVSGAIGASRTFAMTGRYAEAEAICRETLREEPGSGPVSVQLAEILAMTGRSDEAMSILEPVANGTRPSPRGLVKYGQLLEMRGRRAEAAAVFHRVVSRYREGLIFDSQGLAMAAAAGQALAMFHDANRLFREALREDPANLEAEVLWGDLFREKYNAAEARKSYTEVLDRNGRHVPALVGMAGTFSGSAAQKLLEQALEINARCEAALEALAEIAIEDDRLDAAKGYLEDILETNPESIGARTLQAAVAYLEDDGGKYEEIKQWLAQFSPENGRFYARIAEICGRKYRFDQAVQLARLAVETDAQLWSAHNLLGINLLRLGREKEGRTFLENAFERDPFNFWTMNMLEVLDTLERFETRRTGHFIVRMNRRDTDALWPYLQPLFDEMWNTLTAKYDFVPAGPILVEVFDDHQDFAVRTAGLPDIGPLVGVCFGRVITLDSPQALKRQHSINWQEVVWHEFAHVITLQMSHNRLPRWLSEGISVYEEKFGRSEWGRRQDLDLVTAFHQNRILPIKTLNEGFSKAESAQDLGFAYYQSSLVVEYIVDRFGFAALKKLIYRYQTSMDVEDIFRGVFDLPLAEFEQGFGGWLNDRIRQINVDIHLDRPPDPGAGHENGADIRSRPGLPENSNREALAQALRRRIEERPRDFQAHFQLGLIFYENKDYEDAVIHLKIARDLLPEYGGDPNPRLVRADIYEALSDQAAMLRELESLAKYRKNAFDACYKLALAYRRQQDDAKVIYYLERAIAVDPYDLDVHRILAGTALAAADYRRAVREYKILAALDAADPVAAYTNLAQAYLSNGQNLQAKKAALAALEIAPTFERAQNLLLDSLESESISPGNRPLENRLEASSQSE